jgi:4-amino-4-deoxy-L-arabinose transferase-like glycosyltransferase
MIAIIARRIGGQGVGALAGMLWSVYPLGVFIAGLVYPTSVLTLLLACAVLCLMTTGGQELEPRRVMLAGILFGLAALTKPIVLGTIAAMTLWMVYWRHTRRVQLLRLFLLGVVLLLVPWTVRNVVVHDRIVIVQPGLVQHLSRVGKKPKDVSDRGKARKIDAILTHPGAFAARFAREFGRFWELYPTRMRMSQSAYREKVHAQDSRVVTKTVLWTHWPSLISIMSVGPMFFFALIGAGAMWFRKERRDALALLCTIILSFAVGYACFYGKTRYRIPIEPYIIVLSAYGLRQTWAVLWGRPWAISHNSKRAESVSVEWS